MSNLTIATIIFVASYAIFISEGFDPAAVALAGSGAGLMIVLGVNVLAEAEGSRMFFFVGTFILVSGVEQIRMLDWAASRWVNSAGCTTPLTVLVLPWLTGFARDARFAFSAFSFPGTSFSFGPMFLDNDPNDRRTR